MPDSSFIGFTGTPIEKTDANTRAVFGDYISVYDIQRGVADKATLPIKESDLEDFVRCYKVASPSRRSSPRDDQRRDASVTISTTFKKFSYDAIVVRDKANLDIFWLKDDSLEDSENLPPPAELAAEIVVSPEAALEEEALATYSTE